MAYKLRRGLNENRAHPLHGFLDGEGRVRGSAATTSVGIIRIAAAADEGLARLGYSQILS
jgi:hypothetical protein